MRLLFDENFPAPVKKDLVVHECAHVIQLGWAGTKNGELVKRAQQEGFNVLLTFDAGIPWQNALTGRKIAVLLLRPEGQGINATPALMSEVLLALQDCPPGHVQVLRNRLNRRSE